MFWLRNKKKKQFSIRHSYLGASCLYMTHKKDARLYELNVQADESRGAGGLNVGLSLYLHQYFVYASREGSDIYAKTGLSLHLHQYFVYASREGSDT